jgi:ATP-dependent DNA helicase RecG
MNKQLDLGLESAMRLMTVDEIYKSADEDCLKIIQEDRRMRQTMRELQLPAPIFSEINTSHPIFRVVLKNNVEHRKTWLDSDAKRIVGETVFKTLNEHELRMINYVAEYGSISVTDAVRITDKSWGTCKQLLVGLATHGILRHVHHKNILRDSKARFVFYSKP